MAYALTLNEVRARALAFSKEWKGETSESAEKQSFWNDFFSVFGIHRRRVASFEVNVQMLKGARGKIDLFWPGLLLVEHKSGGKDLTTAFKQATDYFDGLAEEDLPKYVIVSDFARIKLYNLDDKTESQFPLAKLHENISAFGFLTGHAFKTFEEAPQVNVEAAQHMADLHDALTKNGYSDQLLLTTEEKDALVRAEPGAKKWIHPFIGSDEFINGVERWCLWMVGITPGELRAMPEVMKRIQTVRENRAASGREATQKLATTPWLFGEIRQPDRPYIVVPLHSSEHRQFIPMGMVGPDVIAGNACSFVATEDLYIFGVLQSTMHMAWVRQVCGRLESRYRYSNEIVYNNYPWPDEPTEKQRDAVRAAAQALLDSRAAQKGQTLAALYDAEVMPVEIRKAHAALDKAVDACYGPVAPGKAKPAFDTDLSRVKYLFERYAALIAAGQMTLNLPKPTKPKRSRKPA